MVKFHPTPYTYKTSENLYSRGLHQRNGQQLFILYAVVYVLPHIVSHGGLMTRQQAMPTQTNFIKTLKQFVFNGNIDISDNKMNKSYCYMYFFCSFSNLKYC